jgi:hypothetical protein
MDEEGTVVDNDATAADAADTDTVTVVVIVVSLAVIPSDMFAEEVEAQ